MAETLRTSGLLPLMAAAAMLAAAALSGCLWLLWLTYYGIHRGEQAIERAATAAVEPLAHLTAALAAVMIAIIAAVLDHGVRQLARATRWAMALNMVALALTLLFCLAVLALVSREVRHELKRVEPIPKQSRSLPHPAPGRPQ
jgi:cytochrome bd-type quinol oxidase subunit 2